MEATAAGVDKSTAIRDFCLTQGISAERTMAFGDNGNDVTMLRAAGVGVAMGNAIQEPRKRPTSSPHPMMRRESRGCWPSTSSWTFRSAEGAVS